MIHVEEKKNIFQHKNVLVVGLARSGTGAANLLAGLGARVSVTDRKPVSSLEPYVKTLSPEAKIVSYDRSAEAAESSEMIVVSPGVPLDIPLLAAAIKKGVPVIGELEVAYQAIQAMGSSAYRRGPLSAPGTEIIGITGTNGKSTTTTLVDLMLRESGYRTLLGGNIGNALTEELMKAAGSWLQSAANEGPAGHGLSADYIVAEISSFQLETIREFRPGIAAILNITPDHLDRYRSMKDYIKAKERIFENQGGEDYLVVNADDDSVMEMVNRNLQMRRDRMPRLLYFSRKKEVEGMFCKDGMIRCNPGNAQVTEQGMHLHSGSIELIRADQVAIKGVHNLENAMAASLIAFIAGCPAPDIKRSLAQFPGLEHRLEFICEFRGVRFINDSKGTNVGAVMKSLEDFENVILIMGGLDKGSDFSVLQDLIKKKVKLLIVLGQAKEKILKDLGTSAETCEAPDLRDAVRVSLSRASAGDIVMLSPGCASFDMFKDFEDRGRQFKEAVRQTVNEF